MHVRQQIIEALVAAVTGLTITADRVHFAPVHALASLPALSVLWGDEEVLSIDSGDGTGPVEMRTLPLLVTGVVMDGLDAAAALDDIAADVEAAVLAETGLLALVELIEYRGASLQFTGELQQPAGTVELRFQAIYRVKSGAPETVIP